MSHSRDEQKLQTFQVYFFGDSVDPFYINLTSGIKQDKTIDNTDIKLMRYGPALFPDNGYYSCDEIPVEWLEQFVDRSTFLNTAAIDDNETAVMNKIGITPFATNRDLDYEFKRVNLHERELAKMGIVHDPAQDLPWDERLQRTEPGVTRERFSIPVANDDDSETECLKKEVTK